MQKHLFFLVTCIITIFHVQAQNQSESGKIKIIITDLKNTDGYLQISLYNSSEGFPDEMKSTLLNRKIRIKNTTVEYEFENIPFGTYAIAIMHDANANDELDTNFIGIPKEGVGVSNNATRSFGPPKFDDSKFDLRESEKKLTIKMRYY